jgi:hypothetical protein
MSDVLVIHIDRKAVTVAGLFALALPAALYAGQVGTLASFTNGTIADADPVNANFAALRTEVNDNDTRIASLEAAATGQIVNVTLQRNCTRRTISNATSIELERFTVDKKIANSTLLVEGAISGWNHASGSLVTEWSWGGTVAIGQNLMYDNTPHGRAYPSFVHIAGNTQTGPQDMVFRIYARTGAAERPFNTYNPNTSDDNRLEQTCSVYTVYEIAN